VFFISLSYLGVAPQNAGTAYLLGIQAKIKPPADKKLFINRWQII
jgi:hypothetical protein